jgi:hypothetical protein
VPPRPDWWYCGSRSFRSQVVVEDLLDNDLDHPGASSGRNRVACGQPSAAIQAKFLSKKSLKSRRIAGPAVAVAGSRAVVDHGVVSHHQTVLVV